MGYGYPSSTDGGIVHKHDSVQPEAGKVAEDIDFDLAVVHKRVSEPHLYYCLQNRHDQRSLTRIPTMCMTYLQPVNEGVATWQSRMTAESPVLLLCRADRRGTAWLVEKPQQIHT